jgi:hypothetical protein
MGGAVALLCAGDEVNISDSDAAETDAAHGSSGPGALRRRKNPAKPGRVKEPALAPEAPTPGTMLFPNAWHPNNCTLPGGSYPPWSWMPPQQIQHPQVLWGMPSTPGSWVIPPANGSIQYPSSCWPPAAQVDMSGCKPSNHDSATRAHRRKKRKHGEDVEAERTSAGWKAKQIRVKPEGEIDGACPRKTGWDDTVRSLVPRLLDISTVDWEGQKPEAVQKLRDHLDSEFEYLGYPLSMQGFRNSVKQYLKSERSRLKARFRAGDPKNPVHVQPAQWEHLKTYWSTEKKVLKSAKMQDARSKVKHVSVVGRKGKAGLEALAVSLLTFILYCFPACKEEVRFVTIASSFQILQVKNSMSPSLTEIGQGLQNLDAEGSQASVSSLTRNH